MKHPPYHLRVNKAVDRLLLVDLLREYGRDCRDFTYYSLAGPFLEDLKVMDLFFPSMRLISLESDKHTADRQEFHRFNSRIDIKRVRLREFLTRDYEPGKKDVFWLDFTDLSPTNFDDFEIVLASVPLGSVIRITLRAQPEIDIDSLRVQLPEEQIAEIQRNWEGKFAEKYYALLPHPSPGAFANRREYSRMVQQMVRTSASRALDNPMSDADFLHVQSTTYDDHTQMLSVTGIVCRRGEEEALKAQLYTVRFCDFDWGEPKTINVPALSIKERLLIEKFLPVKSGANIGEELCKAIPYHIDETKKGHLRRLEAYAECYRDYPNFIRLPI